MYTEQQLEILYNTGNHVYGAAKHFMVERNTHSVDKLKGDSGEQAVAGLLNLWSLTTDAYVFHSLGTHDGSAGETDHVVIVDNSILIIETKTFTGYRMIKVTKHGTVYGQKDNKDHKLSDNKLARKVELYQRRFPEFSVSGLLVVAGYGTSFFTENPKYNACGLQDFFEVLNHATISSHVSNSVKKSAVLFFGRLCLPKK